jgi:hypothetical protein
LSPEVRGLLDEERVIPSVPAAVRARALARARAAVLAGAVTPSTDFAKAPRPGWSVAVAVACITGACLVATAYYRNAVDRAPVTNRHRPTGRSEVVATPAIPSTPKPSIVGETSSVVAPVNRPARAGTPGPEELRLLQQARAAVARRDFAGALRPIAEHGRRFKDGRLAEEREALRVKTLSGLGRTDEAHQAARAFEARFPRSVLLPAVRQMPGPTP